MLALLIEDVTLVKGTCIAIHVRFRGGKTTSVEIDKPRPIALIRKTPPEVVSKVDELLEGCTDLQIADRLNALGYKNWQGQSFTVKKVTVIRMAYKLKSRYDRLRERGLLTAKEIAKLLGVCSATVYNMGRNGILSEHRYGNQHRCLYEPIDDEVFVKGQGGRYSSTQPRFIPTPLTTQDAV